jgi:hypothetical protein
MRQPGYPDEYEDEYKQYNKPKRNPLSQWFEEK